MFRTFAIATTVLACAVGAGTLSAQTSAPAKPAPQAQKTPAPAKATASATPMHNWTKAEITEAQQGLAKAGYFKGKPTGEMNADTRKALKAFEKANNMPANGKLTDSVFAKLKTA
ncbi:MAG TPA: peptidoglycan-binding domain-containing protein [Gemmatimonadales bacterium]